MGVVSKKHERSQTRRTNRIAFGHRLGCVAHSIEWVGDVAHRIRQFGHFSDAARVVGDRSISVKGDHDACHRQHRCCCDRNAVQAAQGKRLKNCYTNKKHWPHGGLHRYGDARDDVGGMSRGGSLGHILDRLVFGARVVLGNPDDGASEHQADQNAKPDVHHRGVGSGKVCTAKHPAS